jgi:hypothetical protein
MRLLRYPQARAAIACTAKVCYTLVPNARTMYTAIIFLVLSLPMQQLSAQTSTGPAPMRLSQDFLLAARLNKPTGAYLQALAGYTPATLAAALPSDIARRTFWINLYNALVLSTLRKEPKLYENKGDFFTGRRYTIAGYRVSLDDIEHGVLRRSKIKLSQGYLNKWFPSAFERQFRVAVLDYRLHFALNCGAKSCPPIAYYKPEQLERQLVLAEANFVQATSRYDVAANTLHVSKIFYWFAADFGGKQGVVALAKRLGIVPDSVSPKLEYDPYDYTLTLPVIEE